MAKSSNDLAFRRWAALQLSGRAAGETAETTLHRALATAPDVESPGKLWEMLLNESSRRHTTGSWFTPLCVAEYLAERLHALLPSQKRSPSILDPACGAGVFLHALAAHYPQAEFHGIDIESNALLLTRHRLAEKVSLTLQHANALHLPPIPCDLIAANPPYVPLPAIPETERHFLRRNFQFARGRFNTWGLFLEWIVRSLRPGGFAALVLPDRLWRNIQDHRLREWFLAQTVPLEITHLDGKGFPHATIDTDLLIFRRRHPDETDTPPVQERTIADLADLRTCPFRRHAATTFQQGGGILFQKIQAASLPFGQIADIRDGVIQSRVGAELFTPRRKRPSDRLLLLGRDIDTGVIRFAGRSIDYRPEVMKRLERRRGGCGLRLRTPEIFERPKILTRQTSDTLIAAYDREGRYYYANTLHGSHITNADFLPEYVMCYLNSAFGRFCYRELSHETGKVFAQVKIALLRQVPILRLPIEVQRAIIQAPESLQKRALTHLGWDKCEISELVDLKKP